MAFLAVLREGLETAVFLLATFQASENAALASTGAFLGVLTAAAVGFGLYRGAVRINLARFFGITSAVLVLVAAGLVMTSLHTAHEAGWVNVGQQQVANLTWLVAPGSVQAAVVTGILGIQPRPTLTEAVGWLAFLVLGVALLAWPRRSLLPRAPLPVGS
jgi:high-affinity iron transporter